MSRTLFLAGYTTQDSPIYGAERRGAPVVAFVRFGGGPILERGYIANPDAVAVMDDTLLGHPEAGVLDGLDATSLVLVNSRQDASILRDRHAIAGRVVTRDLSTLAIEALGHHLLSAPIAGFTVKTTGLASWELLATAIRAELAEAGLTEELIGRNLSVTRTVFEAAVTIGLPQRRPAAAAAVPEPFVLPRLPALAAAPSIVAQGTSALRTTEGWREYRPVIELDRCTRCFLCFALCPEGAIRLDAEHYPVIDYAHCKGCLVCVAECPPAAIARVREEAA